MIKNHEIKAALKAAGMKENTICSVFAVIRKYEKGADFYAEGTIQWGLQVYLKLRREKGLRVV